MKKILIISYHFAPENNIAAIRWSKFSKYLHKLGDYKIDIITKSNIGLIDSTLIEIDSYINKYFYIKESAILKFLAKKKLLKKYFTPNSSTNLKIIEKLYHPINIIRYTVQTLVEVIEYISNKSLIKETPNDYDLIISSFGPIINIRLGILLKKDNPSTKFVIDFRDTPFQSTTTLFEKFLFNHILNSSRNLLSGVIAVSQGILDSITIGVEKKVLITNGYDLDDTISFTPKKRSKIQFSFAGSLYDKRSDLVSFFLLINKLIKEIPRFERLLTIYYAGVHSEEFKAAAENANLLPYCEISHLIPRKDVIKVYEKTTVALVFAWESELEKGNITGKIYELIGFEIPTLIILNTNSGESEIIKLFGHSNQINILQTNDFENSSNESIRFIKKLINDQSQSKPIYRNNKKISDSNKFNKFLYSYQHLTNKLNNFISELI